MSRDIVEGEPLMLEIGPAYPCGHIDGGISVRVTDQSGYTFSHRMPAIFRVRPNDAVLCRVCDRFVPRNLAPQPEAGA